MRGDMADEARDSISSEEVPSPICLFILPNCFFELPLLPNRLLPLHFSSHVQVTVGHWGNVMPPVLVNNLVPSHTVPAIQVVPTF